MAEENQPAIGAEKEDPEGASEELLRALTLFVWGFEHYSAKLRLHWGCRRLLWWRRNRIPPTGSLEQLGIRYYTFHGFGLGIEDEFGLQLDADFYREPCNSSLQEPTEEPERQEPTEEHERERGGLNVWKLWRFIDHLPQGFLADFRGMSGHDRLEKAFARIPAQWRQDLLKEARDAFP
jgi:hypothetical protein